MSNQKEVLKYCQTCKGTYIYPRWTRCENCQKEEAMSDQPLDIEAIRYATSRWVDGYVDLTAMEPMFKNLPTLCDEVEALRDKMAPLTWTKERPTEVGMYWVRFHSSGNIYTQMLFRHESGKIAFACWECDWAGPIPPPVEPTKGDEQV